jgi:hypothetical protein
MSKELRLSCFDQFRNSLHRKWQTRNINYSNVRYDGHGWMMNADNQDWAFWAEGGFLDNFATMTVYEDISSMSKILLQL